MSSAMRSETGTDRPAGADALAQLVARLDALGPRPRLRDLESALQSAQLDLPAVASRVRIDQRHYHRERVVLRDAYELLVMTWLPGQASVPHDHGGSICAMKVVQGTAEERTYQVLEDGLVRPFLRERYPVGRVVAGDDAAIHSVHNADMESGTLVTVHVYSPPLRDFRRYMERPTAASDLRPARPSIAVVGGGFSGSMVAANLLEMARKSGVPVDVHLIDRRGIVGEGVAYGTREAVHLLNVPASGMSAWPDHPGHFLEWAQARDAATKPYDFLPRRNYGDYVREVLQAAARDATDAALHVHADEVRRVVRDGNGRWMVHAGRGASVACDVVVLATGHRPPGDPFEGRWSGPRHRFIADPWQPFAVSDILPEDPVVIVGTGLSAIDVVFSLAGPGAPPRKAPIWVLSRRGLMPRPHAPAPVRAADMAPVVEAWERASGTPRLRHLLHAVRACARAADDWRTCIDGLRPHTQRIWSRLDLTERRRFMRHVRGFWEVHRHRTAPKVSERLAELASAGGFQVLRGRLVTAHANADRVRVEASVREVGGAWSPRTLEAAWVVNCSGPTPSSAPQADPAVSSLCAAGLARSDALGLGLETDAKGHAIDASGQAVKDLLVVGTLRKAQLWESTAVPELRVQAAEAAQAVMERLRSPSR